MRNPADQSSDLVTLFAPMWIWDGKLLDGLPPALYLSPFSVVVEILRVMVQPGAQDGGHSLWGESHGQQSQRPGLPSTLSSRAALWDLGLLAFCSCASRGQFSSMSHLTWWFFGKLSPSLSNQSPTHIFQLVQGSTVLIRVREDASVPREGQKGITWTGLKTCWI